MTLPTIGFAGLTHLGLVSAAAVASKGFDVVGFDPDESRLTGIRRGPLPVVEPGLDALVASGRGRLRLENKATALGSCDVVYISADVPTGADGVADLGPISGLVSQVIPTLGERAVLVVLCQVPPGFTRRLPVPGERLFYQVETLVFGRAVERALHPERFIVGCQDPGRPLPSAYAALLGSFGCPILPMGYESAELAKIAINCCLVAMVTVTNTLAELSEQVGADWGEIAPALRLDRRIGQHAYLTPGLGLAGGNLERDLATVLDLAARAGTDAEVVRAFIRNSRHRRDWVLRVLHREVLAARSDAVVAVLGLAYKENTDSTRNSPSLALIRHLGPWPLRVYDPVVPTSIVQHPAVVRAGSALEAAKGAHATVIMTPWPEFRQLAPNDLAAAMVGRTVIDPYGMLSPQAVTAAALDHFVLGRPARRAPGGGRPSCST